MRAEAKHWASLVCVAAWSGLIGWGWTKAHPAPTRIGGFTSQEMIAKAAPACRLMAGGMLGAMEAIGAESPKSSKPDAIWAVDLHVRSPRSREMQTVHTVWNGYTGDLLYAAKVGGDAGNTARPVLNHRQAAAAARDWLRSLGMLRTAAHWQIEKVDLVQKRDWKVVASADDRTITARIDGRNGDLLMAMTVNNREERGFEPAE